MNRIALTLLGVAAFALGACQGTSDTLSDGRTSNGAGDPNGTAGGETTTFDHSNDPGGAAPGTNFQPPEPGQVKLVGSSCPEGSANPISAILNVATDAGPSGSCGNKFVLVPVPGTVDGCSFTIP